MVYINPFDLLEVITSEKISDTDNSILKKAKRKLLTELELSDLQEIYYRGRQLIKSDCLKILDDLDDKNKTDFHFFIFQKKTLLDFLTNGDLSFFNNYSVESIYKSIDFLNFVSPYFTESYNKSLTRNFKIGNYENTSLILSVKPLTNDVSIEACYKGTYLLLRAIDAEINQLKQDIKNEDHFLITKKFKGIEKIILEKIQPALLNILPFYFQGIRNQLAESINNLSTVIYNDPYECTIPAFQLMQITNDITTEGLTHQKIVKDYFIVKKRHDKELNKPLVDKYDRIFAEILIKLEAINKKEITSEEAYNWIDKTIEIAYINALDFSFQETKDNIALCLKALSIAIWNGYGYSVYPSNILKKALSIDVTEEIKGELLNAKNKLNELTTAAYTSKPATINNRPLQTLSSNRPKPVVTQAQPIRSTQKESSGNGAVALVVICIILGIVGLATCSHDSQENNYKSSTSIPDNQPSPTYTPSEANSSNNGNSSTLSNTSSQPASTSNYKYSYPANGNIIDCHKVHPQYDYKIDNELEITVGNNANAAIKMINETTQKCIRYVYIGKNSAYKIKNIPQGRYYLKIAYGDEWGRKEEESPCANRFVTNVMSI